jgi:hypothetical protein
MIPNPKQIPDMKVDLKLIEVGSSVKSYKAEAIKNKAASIILKIPRLLLPYQYEWFYFHDAKYH